MTKAQAVYQVTNAPTKQESKSNSGAQAIKGEVSVTEKKTSYYYNGENDQDGGTIGEKPKYAAGVGNMCQPNNSFFRERLPQR